MRGPGEAGGLVLPAPWFRHAIEATSFEGYAPPGDYRVRVGAPGGGTREHPIRVTAPDTTLDLAPP
jgi:hypothetical protein